MLDAHPELAIPLETHFVGPVLQNCEHAADPRRAFVEALTSHRRWPNFHVDPRILAARVAEIDPFDVGEALRAFYRIYAENHGKTRWGDKTPGYVSRMSFIHKLLPEATFIHIIRDGRAVAVSLNDAWRSSGRSKSISEAATWWMTKIAKARREAERVPFYLEIRYEELVVDPASTLRSICDFIDLCWNPVMLDYYKTSEERLTEIVVINPAKGKVSVEQQRARHARTSGPPDASRIDRWRTEMSASERREFERIAGALLVELGYAI